MVLLQWNIDKQQSKITSILKHEDNLFSIKKFTFCPKCFREVSGKKIDW